MVAGRVTGPAEAAILPVMRNPRTGRCWGLRLALLALLIQLAATAVPMPVLAGTPDSTGLPAWLANSLCQGAPAEAPDGGQSRPGHLICPVCFVLAAASGAVPPLPASVAIPASRPLAAPAMPRARELPPQFAGSATLSRAPPSV